ncbi:acyl-CoA dehydrogenase [Mycobacterium antarcticum]|uniref:acyl-CoA dehydrogenase family protein n=1 Tax=Mycolicibacterium sp. TUM20985 TaxID=3023370 RepID=UPI002573433B|nr:acyl-CoA dehydrogenase family protein [Mycolicibacterium sp. TUM20985]BDX34493.1 acyl-CoA dehydrogenase [Mycolicibacterium sp. TUM20985]
MTLDVDARFDTPASSGIADVVGSAAAAADAVDRHARFPAEAVEAMRAANFLSCSLPTGLGGRSASITELAAIARALGAACSSAAMVFAMHHTQALVLTKYANSGPIAELTASIAADESLLASATTEITTGGDIGSSTCAIDVEDETVTLRKNASVISYGQYADFICVTARRTADSPANDQVLLVCPASDTRLEPTGTWDVLGFRGTCSPGFLLDATTARRNVIAQDYASIAATTMVPASHTLWSNVWLGIADAAVGKARTAVRQAVRKAEGKPVPKTLLLADLLVRHQVLEAHVQREVQRYEDFRSAGSTEATIGFTLAMNNLKIDSSVSVAELVIDALRIVGLNGYREDHPLTMGRLLRDSFAPQLMVSNDRIRQTNAGLALAHRG